MTTLFLILIVVVILTCILLNNISVRIGVPTLLAFIVLGIVFGNVGAIPVYLDNHSFAKDVCSVALLFIMFYGGFGTRWEAVKPVVRESVLLASLGLLARPAMLHKAILPALAISAFMLLVARPAAVFGILTPFRKYTARQQWLVSFVGLRGAASIVFAIMAFTGVGNLNNDLFSIIDVGERSKWDGKKVMDLGLPKNLIPTDWFF